jgi:N-acyl-phosphatidylethanolamine-hydrolysing phospholipase D
MLHIITSRRMILSVPRRLPVNWTFLSSKRLTLQLTVNHDSCFALPYSQQRRQYLYLPTSWKEVELRWLRSWDAQRTIYVKLLKDKVQDPLRNKYNATRRKFKTDGKELMETARRKQVGVRMRLQSKWSTQASKLVVSRDRSRRKWKLRSHRMRNRMVRYSRNYADRVQRVWNRNLLQLVTYREKLGRRLYQKMQFIRQPVTLTEYAEESWFCARTGRPMASRDATGRFVNPWLSESTGGIKSVGEIAQWQWERFQRNVLHLWNAASAAIRIPPSSTMAPVSAVAASSASPSYIQDEATTFHSSSSPGSTVHTTVPEDQLRCTWIGHSTCLVQQGSVNVLTDPIFSVRCSPFQNLPIGVARDVPAAIQISDLPSSIDVCVISHDHYDHLDRDSVVTLNDRVQFWVVPLGIRQWLQEKCDVPFGKIIELEWWESVKLQRTSQAWEVVAKHSAIRGHAFHPALTDPDVLAVPLEKSMDCMWLTCCPAQHWASRTFFDRNFRLWCSFAVFLPGSKFYFGGDSALPKNFPLFEQIRDYLGGSVDLAALPVGAYEPEFYMHDSHMNPAEAVSVHQTLNSTKSLAIHWGTFALSEEPMEEPPVKLRQAAATVNADFVAVPHGDFVTIDCRRYSDETSEDNEYYSFN